MQIWDVSGQEKFKSIVNLYYRDADGAIVVYDQTDLKSFENVKSWLQELEDKAPKNIEIILVSNKCDLADQEKVSEKQARDLAFSHQILFRKISAKKNIGVDELFQKLGEKVLARPSNVILACFILNETYR